MTTGQQISRETPRPGPFSNNKYNSEYILTFFCFRIRMISFSTKEDDNLVVLTILIWSFLV